MCISVTFQKLFCRTMFRRYIGTIAGDPATRNSRIKQPSLITSLTSAMKGFIRKTNQILNFCKSSNFDQTCLGNYQAVLFIKGICPLIRYPRDILLCCDWCYKNNSWLDTIGLKIRSLHLCIWTDIGVNLTDEMYQGIYHGKKKHEADLDDVLQRSWEDNLTKMIITGTSLTDSKAAIELSKKDDRLFATVGCHPTRCGEFEAAGTTPDKYLEELLALTQHNLGKVVAVGECGLDYDRVSFCSVEVQKKYFEKQISVAEATGLLMFLHCRGAAMDLCSILRSRRDNIAGGVVHSFDGTSDELRCILDLDLYVGINGCSLKTAENLKVASEIPLGRLIMETDSPWCEIRPSHAGYKYLCSDFPAKKCDKWERGTMVKSRNEPRCIVQVLEVLSAIRGEEEAVLAEKIYENTCNLFFPNEKMEKN